MENQRNKYPFGYGEELSDSEALENFREIQPILLRYGLSLGLGFLSGFLLNQSSAIADNIPAGNPSHSAPASSPAPAGSPAPKVSRAPMGEAFGIAAVGFICASAAAGGNPVAIVLAIAGCATAAASQYFKK